MSVQKQQKPPICSAGSINAGHKLAAPVRSIVPVLSRS